MNERMDGYSRLCCVVMPAKLGKNGAYFAFFSAKTSVFKVHTQGRGMKKLLGLMIGFLVFLVGPAYALTVTPTSDSATLVDSLLGSGISVISSAFTGASGSAGLFSGAGDAIGINSGIILTSGQASLAVGPNDESSATAVNSFPGSATLDALIPGFTTQDAAILDIVFTSDTGNLFFNFVFASEEYNQYVGSNFNDVFGFFLDGVNIALLPDETPVSINNVNLGSNAAYYINNSVTAGSDGPVVAIPVDLQYDGFTTVLTAQALGLSAGEHTISLQIADAGDSSLDSAIFLQGGSFSGEQPEPNTVPEPSTLLLVGAGLLGLFRLRRKA